MTISSKILNALFILLLPVAFVSCGANDYAGGGIGGTGISVGKITASGTGTVDVNGIVFETSNASVTLDGKTGGQNNLKTGMVVKVRGKFNQDGKTGVAASIEFRDNLEGPVDDFSRTSNTIAVLGQTVKLGSTTYFDDFSDTNGDKIIDVYDVSFGNIVEVSGFIDANGIINATYISLKAVSFESDGFEIEVKGTITDLNMDNQTFAIGYLTIDFSSADFVKDITSDSLTDGLYIEIKSTSGPYSNILVASSIEIEEHGHDADEGERIEVEGFVTDVTGLDSNRFEIEGQPVQIMTNTLFKNDGSKADIGLNVKIEVKGSMDAYGVLVADEIEIELADEVSDNESGHSDDEESGE